MNGGLVEAYALRNLLKIMNTKATGTGVKDVQFQSQE